MPIIDITDISKVYGFGDATTVALDEVSLKVEKGEFVAIMGPSGCGKTTLLQIIGLLDRPTFGSFYLDGKNTAKLSQNKRAKARRDKIGFIFQSFNLLPKLNVIENVALPLAYKGSGRVRRQKKASEILERMGMKDREYYLPHQLSGGQIQRAAIARALINNPSIIIADEPTGNLDSANSRLVMELLSEIHLAGNTILMVTHNPELTRYASRVIYMYDGYITTDEHTAIGTVPQSAREFDASLKTNSEGVVMLSTKGAKHKPSNRTNTKPTGKKRGRKPTKRNKKVAL